MNVKELVVSKSAVGVLVPDPGDVSKDVRHRVGGFAAWLDTSGMSWWGPDLAAYAGHLRGRGLAEATVNAHLSTIRGRYRRLLKDNDTRARLFAVASQQSENFAEQKAVVDEVVTRIENAIDPKAVEVETVTRQDRPDSDFTRLTSAQASALMAAPGLDTLRGVRDTAVISLLLCTGIREAELSGLDVGDLRQELGGELALHVRKGKGCKERLVPYGELSWVLAIVDKWLEAANIKSGPVFRGLYKRGYKLRPGRLSVRAIEYVLEGYPVGVEGEIRAIKPHDCRRTYARRQYDAGVELVALQQNLGHKQLETTLGYIGELDASRRRPKSVYRFDLSKLSGVPVQGALSEE